MPVCGGPAVTAADAVAAIRERHGVRAALLHAIEAARDRSTELGHLY